MKKVLVTGGAGFIGSNFVRHVLRKYPETSVVNLDKLTYAGNRENLADVENDPRYSFVHGDISDEAMVALAMDGCDTVVNFAAETHVDRSLHGARAFLETDVTGVFVLLEEARKRNVKMFVQISTDEVYGTIPPGKSATEEWPLLPRNPYSAAKAGGDRLAWSYWASHGVPVIVTRASNNYGAFQYPEKMLPLFVTNALEGERLPLYGDGRNVRDWLHVQDHCEAIDFLLEYGQPGEVYNIAGGNERENVDVTRRILDVLGKSHELIKFVTDRPGHDRRYSLDGAKLAKLGWSPRHTFEDALPETVRWYVDHPEWWKAIKQKDAAFREYYRRQYGERLAGA